jgi:hypothetical protein
VWPVGARLFKEDRLLVHLDAFSFYFTLVVCLFGAVVRLTVVLLYCTCRPRLTVRVFGKTGSAKRQEQNSQPTAPGGGGARVRVLVCVQLLLHVGGLSF